MKRLMLVWIMILTALTICASASAAVRVTNQIAPDPVELDDFTITVPHLCPYETWPKEAYHPVFHCFMRVENQIPGIEITIVWNPDYVGTAKMDDNDIDFWANWVLNSSKTDYARMGIQDLSFELDHAEFISVDSRQALAISCRALNGTGDQRKTYYTRIVVVDHELGAYCLSCISLEPGEDARYLDALIRSLKWKE
jgi:hypothetical protein